MAVTPVVPNAQDVARIEAEAGAAASAKARWYLNRPPVAGDPEDWARRFDDLPYLPAPYTPLLDKALGLVYDSRDAAEAKWLSGFVQRTQIGRSPIDPRPLPPQGPWRNNKALPTPEQITGFALATSA